MINLVYPDDTYDLTQFNSKDAEVFFQHDPYQPQTLEWMLNRCRIFYKKSTKVDKSMHNFLAINLSSRCLIDEPRQSFHNLPDKYIGLLENENTWLLIYHGFEANSHYYRPVLWDELYHLLRSKGIPPKKICFITGDLNAKENHVLSDHEYFSKINVCPIDLFEMVHMYRIEEKNIHFLLDSHNLYQTTEKTHNFLSLNAVIRDNKQIMLFYLNKFNLLNNNLVSCLWTELDRKTRSASETMFKHFNFDGSDYQTFLNFIKKHKVRHVQTVQEYSLDILNSISPVDLYYKTKFSLVNETHAFDRIEFITEKTYKPLAIGHPFIVFGSCNILKHLKNWGYETFPELFDESYDQVTGADRLNKIIKNLQRNVEIEKYTYEKIKHNKQVFFEQRSRLRNKNNIENFLLNQ